MPIRDLLLQLSSHPDPTPEWAIETALALAERFEARLSGALCHVHIPRISNYLADKLVHINEAIAAENAKSNRSAKALLSAFASRVGPGRMGEQILIECGSMVTPTELAARARTHDLTILPAHGQPEMRFLAEGLIFESGRPVLLLPDPGGAWRGFDTVAIGWDGGRAAARALADALPLLAQAKAVRLVTVTGDKRLAGDATPGDACRHLSTHGIDAAIVETEAAGLDAGSALLRYCAQDASDLLVMGAYGHSRAREFLLGGATESVLAEARLPVLISH